MTESPEVRLVTEASLGEILSDTPGVNSVWGDLMLPDKSTFDLSKGRVITTYNAFDLLSMPVDTVAHTLANLVIDSNTYHSWHDSEVYISGPDYMLAKPLGTPTGKPFALEFILQDDFFALVTNAYSDRNPITISVDGELPETVWDASTGAYVDTNKQYSVSVTSAHVISFKAKRPGTYRIRVDGLSRVPTTSFIYARAGSIKPASYPAIKGGVVSDSYNDVGWNTYDTIPSELERMTGFQFVNASIAGTGFWNYHAGVPTLGAPWNTTPLHYSSDLVFNSLILNGGADLDFIMVNGSINDLQYSDAVVLAAIDTFMNRVRSDLRADMPVFWVGVEPLLSTAYAGINRAQELAREQVIQAHLELDPNYIGGAFSSRDKWLTGADQTQGNQSWMLGVDQVHLSPEGLTAWARLVINEFKRAPISIGAA